MSLLGLAILGRRNEPLYLCDCVRVLREAKQSGRRQPPPRRGLSDASGASSTSASASVTVENPAAGKEDESGARDAGSSSSAVFTVQGDPMGLSQQQQQQQQASEPPLLSDDDDHVKNDDGDNKNDDDKVDNDDPFGFKEARQSCDLGQSLSFEQSLHLHAALDHLEERIETSSAGLPVVTSGRTGHWLGLLARHEDGGSDDSEADSDSQRHVVYGYVTATNIKLLVMVRPPVAKESHVRMFLNGIHDSYITHSMNPFSSVKPGQRIQSKKFDSHIREAVRDYEDNRVQQQQEQH